MKDDLCTLLKHNKRSNKGISGGLKDLVEGAGGRGRGAGVYEAETGSVQVDEGL